ncbi:hypothetical protein OG462_06755 [Streptomyces sp. NBC_01077]|uniref:hypothetical protein n=1 Tax=Streptomyces sp. NBC_01077 TaxID=2903746 RepID=UPI003863237B|nr:hypothetical protein OG462_06755 [Streptomyces sp. NBC_01077]
MSWYFAVPIALLGVLFAISGVAVLRTGRLLPWQRRHVRRTGLFGRAQLVMAAAFAIQAGGAFSGGPAARSGVGVFGGGVLLCGLVLLTLAQRPRPDR